ncbi:MAG: CBS domain-containing protein [Thermoplasmata archaeon]|nr:CBS domain-containing protein [Thermoplasmata archaeon]
MYAKDIMTTDLIVVKIPSNRSEVLSLMVKHKKTGLPVLDSKNKFVGTITRKNIFDNPNEEQISLLMVWDPPTVKSKDTIRKAAKLLVKHNIHRLPVVDKNKLVGHIAPTDFLKVIEKKNAKAPVSKYVRSPCVPIYQDTPLAVAAAIINVTKVYALPVLDKKARLVGIITDRDLFNLGFIDKKIALSELGLGEDEDAWTWEGLRNIMKLYYEESKTDLPNVPVKEIMVKDPTSIMEKTSVSEAARIMWKHDFGQLPIADSKDRLISIVYDLDIIASLYE